jgi:hypothetical protein
MLVFELVSEPPVTHADAACETVGVVAVDLEKV